MFQVRKVKKFFHFLKEKGFKCKTVSSYAETEIYYSKGETIIIVILTFGIQSEEFNAMKLEDINMNAAHECIDVIIIKDSTKVNLLNCPWIDGNELVKFKTKLRSVNNLHDQMLAYAEFIESNLSDLCC